MGKALSKLKFKTRRNLADKWAKRFSSLRLDEKFTGLTNDQANGDLKLYLNDLLAKNIAFPIPEPEVCDIRDAVEETVERLLTAVETRDDTLVVDEILYVGSFYNGTRIEEPSEFDFLIVLDRRRLAGGGTITVHTYHPGWLEFVDDDNYRVYDLFHERVDAECGRLCDDEHLSTIAKPTGNMRITRYDTLPNVDRHGPASTLRLSWTGTRKMKVSVDLVPTFREKNIAEYVPWSGVAYGGLRDALVDTGSFLLIGQHKWGEWWLQPTFTETESALVKQKFSPSHRDVLKVLKYLCCGPIIVSYDLKQYAIHHHCTCRRDTSESIAHCVVDVLLHMRAAELNMDEEAVRIPDLFRQHRYPDGHIRVFYYDVFVQMIDSWIHVLLHLADDPRPFSRDLCERLYALIPRLHVQYMRSIAV